MGKKLKLMLMYIVFERDIKHIILNYIHILLKQFISLMTITG